MSWYSDGEKVSKWYLYHSGDADESDFPPIDCDEGEGEGE